MKDALDVLIDDSIMDGGYVRNHAVECLSGMYPYLPLSLNSMTHATMNVTDSVIGMAYHTASIRIEI